MHKWFFVIACLLMVAFPALAKGPAHHIVISGGDLDAEIVITESYLLTPISMAMLEEFPNAVEAPVGITAESGYQLKRYFRTNGGEYMQFDSVRYVPDPDGGRGHIFYEGIHNGWSEYDGKWFLATAEGESALQDILRKDYFPGYLMLVGEGGDFRFLDPLTLEEVVSIQMADWLPAQALYAGKDGQTIYFTRDDGTFQIMSLTQQTSCASADVPEEVHEQMANLKELSAAINNRWQRPTGIDAVAVAGEGYSAFYFYPYAHDSADKAEVDGGIFWKDLQTGRPLRHLLPEVGLSQVVMGGDMLYAAANSANSSVMELYVLDARAGTLQAQRTLESGVWTLGYAALDLPALAEDVNFDCE